jgi:ribosomal protein S15P/S13E
MSLLVAFACLQIVLLFIVFFIVLRTGLAPEIPEDLYHLIKKAVNIRRHLEKNRKDTDSKFRLILVESRIHRLARYYKVLSRFSFYSLYFLFSAFFVRFASCCLLASFDVCACVC